jgi:hypothetical protein
VGLGECGRSAPLHKRWLLSFTSLLTGREVREGAGCGIFFPQPAREARMLVVRRWKRKEPAPFEQAPASARINQYYPKYLNFLGKP